MRDVHDLSERQGITQLPESDDEIDLGYLAGVLWSGRYRIALIALLALALGAFHVANTAPTYQADALLQLEERSNRMSLPASMSGLGGSDPRSVTEIEILRSRNVLGQVVADLNLDWEVQPKLAPVVGTLLARYPIPLPQYRQLSSYARPGESLTLTFLEVPPRWVDAALTLEVTATGYRLIDPDGQVHQGVPGEMLRDPDLGFALRIESLDAPPGRVFTIRQRNEIAAIGRLRGALTVSERGRQSGILEVRFDGPSRTENVRVLNAVNQAYLRQNISRSAAEAENSLRFIESQMPDAEAAVRRAERTLNDYRQQQFSVDLSIETENLLTQLTRVETELRELQVREDELSQRYTTSHPNYQQLLAERGRMLDRQAVLRGEVLALPETQREVLNLSYNVELARQFYMQLLTRLQEMQVVRASTVGNVRVLDSAASGGGPIAPRRNLILAISLFLGLAAGCAYVLVRRWLRHGVQSAEELEKAGLPVFATINFTAHAERKHKGKGPLPILAIDAPTDLAVEALRSLRTSLHFGMIDARTRSLAVTSSAPGAGKSFTSLNLAVVAAQAGQRVCLVDADMRRGYLWRYFDLPRHHPGLAEVLAGAIPLSDALNHEVLPNLAFLHSGRYPPNPSELLMRRDFGALIEALNSEFDLTILDCPPTLAVTDPVIIGRSVGATVLVARHDVTPMPEVVAVRNAMNSAGVRLTGAILNGCDPRKVSGGYGHTYRYEYQSHKE